MSKTITVSVEFLEKLWLEIQEIKKRGTRIEANQVSLKIMTVEQLMLMHCSKRQVFYLCEQGKLPFFRLNSRIYFFTDEVIERLKQLRAGQLQLSLFEN